MSIPAVDGRCGECGFDYDDFDAAQLVTQLDSLHDVVATRIAALSDEGLRRRPKPDVWSILEYTCHVRDVLRIQDERLRHALVEDRPVFQRSGMWQWPERDAYNSQRPVAVLDELRTNAAALAATVRDLNGDQLGRRLVYSYPEPTERTVLWLICHTGHEARHHLFDIDRILGEGGTP